MMTPLTPAQPRFAKLGNGTARGDDDGGGDATAGDEDGAVEGEKAKKEEVISPRKESAMLHMLTSLEFRPPTSHEDAARRREKVRHTLHIVVASQANTHAQLLAHRLR